MASISRQANGTRTIQFIGPDRKRRTIRLGKTPQKTAEAVKLRVEQLNAAVTAGHAPDPDTSRWVAGLEPVLYDRLAAAGLAQPREQRDGSTLQAFIDGYIARRTDAKPATRTVYGHTRRNLVEFFGSDKLLQGITRGDADHWRLYLAEQGLAPNTVRRRCGIAKQFFRAAVRSKLVAENVFDDLECGVRSNRARDHFITREDAGKVLDACPDAEWRLIFALSRYGGLRCPSEHLALRWCDVDWEAGRVTVTSPKTEHHAGGESRVMPLFPELRPYLEDCFELAEPGSEFCITRYRSANANLRTQLLRIIRRAGVKPWPKLFHNLRATRETELAAVHPLHVVCEWIGNSSLIAQEHYLRVTDADFERATGALQNPMQQPPGIVGNALQGEPAPEDRIPVLQGIAESRNPLLYNEMGVEGLEHDLASAISGNGLRDSRSASAAKSDALSAKTAPLPPDLARLVAAWEDLPEAVRQTISGLVDLHQPRPAE